MSDVNKDKIVSDLKVVLDDAESLLSQAANATGEQAVLLRERALSSLRHARETVLDVQETVIQKTKKAADVTDDYVHEHPWQAMGIAALVGVAVGVLIGRR